MKKQDFIEAVLELTKNVQPTNDYGRFEVRLCVISEADWHGGRQNFFCPADEIELGDFDYIEFYEPISEAWKHRHHKFYDEWDFGYDGRREETYTLEDMVEGFWRNFLERKEVAK